ncbi:MAG TPA: hypothetical protein VGH46_06665 [Gaiellaceae bacterium]
MHSGIRLVAAAFAVALATSIAVPAAGAKPAAPRTLLKTNTPIRAFAQDSSRFAWVDGKWHVDAHKLGSKAKTLLIGTAHPYTGGTETVTPQLALAGSRVAWTRNGGGNDFETGVFVRNAGAKAKARLVFNTAADREERTGSYFGALAAGSSTLAFTTVHYQCVDPADCSELAAQPSGAGGAFRVIGTSRTAQVPNAPGSLDLAVSAGRIALLRAPALISPTEISDVSSPSLVRPAATVEIRNVTTGALISAFTPPGTVKALALTGSVAAVIDDLGDGTTQIERYDATTGALLGSTGDIAAGNTLAAGANTFVYSVGGGKIEAMDATTGAQRVLAVSPAAPIGLSIAGKRVAWAVNEHGHGQVLALTLP